MRSQRDLPRSLSSLEMTVHCSRTAVSCPTRSKEAPRACGGRMSEDSHWPTMLLIGAARARRAAHRARRSSAISHVRLGSAAARSLTYSLFFSPPPRSKGRPRKGLAAALPSRLQALLRATLITALAYSIVLSCLNNGRRARVLQLWGM